VDDLREEYTIQELCDYLHVSVSGYYKYKQRQDVQKDTEVSELILKIYHQYNGIYGYRRIHMELDKKYGLVINHKKVFRLYNELGLRSKIRKKRRNLNQYHQKEAERIAPNLLGRNFNASKLNEKWVTDITEVGLKDRVLYVSAIMDLYNREIIGYQMGESADRQLVLKTIDMALKQRGDVQGVILHSDRGPQYTSRTYHDTLESLEIRVSMSRKGNCYDNACIESFFSHLKTEAIYPYDVQTMEELEQKIKDYIVHYNENRRQRRLNKLSPVEYRLQHQVA
jgi:putative transposase